MIPGNAILADDIDDEAKSILVEMAEELTWTKRKLNLRDNLVKLLSASGYVHYIGCPYRYCLHGVGNSYLYDVPLYKRGVLKPFRGKRVRIVCVRSGRYKRDYMAGVVGDTPEDLIVEKLVHKYTFPEYARAVKVLYSTRRFQVVELPKGLQIMTDREREGFIDSQDWPLVLIDGKSAELKGRLRINSDGSVVCALLGWGGDHVEASLGEAARYLIGLVHRGWGRLNHYRW